MKCEDVQKAIWSSLLSSDDSAHIHTCKSCQGEHALMEKIVRDLSNIDTPQPSKSLKPSRDVIEKAVRSNKRLPFVRWTSIAASVAVVITAGTLFAQQFSTSPAQLTPATPPQPAPLGPSIPPEEAQQEPTADPQKQDGVEIDVKFEPTAENTELVDALKEYIDVQADPALTDKIAIVKVELASKPGIDNRIVAYVNMEVSNVSESKAPSTAFPSGTQFEVIQFARQKDGKLVVDTYANHFKSDEIEQTINYWAQSLRDRNAVLQWALLTRQRQADVMSKYELANWTLPEKNASGKSVKSWEIIGKDPKKPDIRPEYEVQLWFDEAKTDGEVTRVQLVQETGIWRISSFLTSFTSPNETNSQISTGRTAGIVFDPSTAKIGDKIGTMTLKDLNVVDDGQIYSAQADFSGRVTISGTFQRMADEAESNGGRVLFLPDPTMYELFPVLARETRPALQLLLRNDSDFSEHFGPSGTAGTATIEVEDFSIQLVPKGGFWDEATVVKVISSRK